MIEYSEDRRIIKQAIVDNKLIVFVGAGASINSGIPLWRDAVEKIYTKIGSKAVDINDSLKIPQIYFNARGEKEYTELVKDIFRFDDKKPNKIHELIVKLNPSHVITTNYDDFLEKAFIANGEFLDVIHKDTDIPYCKNSRMIIKMHGGFIYNNFVFKEDDYLNYSQNFALIETFIKALVAKNIILFIGYSYSDPDTKQIFNWVKNVLGNNFQRAYFIDGRNLYDLHTVNYYRNLGINIIYSSEHLEKFKKEDVYDNTIKMLEYIINDNRETDITDTIYNSALNINQLNYILAQYIPSILRNLDIVYDDMRLRLTSDKSESLFESLNNESNVQNSEKLALIKTVFEKTIIKYAYIYDKRTHIERRLCNFDRVLFNKIYDNIDNQNYLNIKNFPDKANIVELDNQGQLQVAYCYYTLQEYHKCYYLLKKISLSYKQQ